MALLFAWAVLNVLFNATFPGPEPGGWYLLPSLDATVLLAVATVVRLPAAALAAIGGFAVVVRLFRFGDGLTRRYFNQPLSLGLDLPLVGELPRLLAATVKAPVLVAGAIIAIALLCGLGWLAARAVARGAPRDRPSRLVFAAVVALAAVGSLLAGSDERRLGLFGRSAVPRLIREVAFAASLERHRAQVKASIAPLGHPDLARLHGASLLVFLIESYGATVLDQPDYARLIEPVYQRVASRLGGFHIASGLLDSPTYAGRSWLAQQTLATGVRTADRIADAVVQEARPPTIAQVFRQAGYRTVLVQPANRYRSISRWTYGFEILYQGWDFDYRGPAFGWANMPDQYVLDAVHRRESRAPLLAVYALQSSHAPWSQQPPLIEDWAALKDGSVFNTVPARSFDARWTNLGEAGPAYVASLSYDLEVLARYLESAAGDALVVILGDHQPVAEVTRYSPSHAVPVHVLSRRAELVQPFLSRGYVSGMRPQRSGAVRGLETFLPNLLTDFSTEK
jgi:hypothetical protein